MSEASVTTRPVPLHTRGRTQRRLIRRVVEQLARRPGATESFGQLVRLVHITALTALPAGMDGALAERRLLRACRARLQPEQAVRRHRPAA